MWVSANICVGATDVWESVFKVRRMILAVQCFSTASVAQWCVLCYMKLVFQHLLFPQARSMLAYIVHKTNCPIYISQLDLLSLCHVSFAV